MAFGESISGYSFFDCTLRVPEFSFGTLTCWSCWLIISIGDSNITSFFMLHWYICMRYLTCWLWDWLSWLRILFFLCASFPCLLSNTDMLIILIDHLALLSIVILFFAMIVLIALHIWIYCYTSFDLTCRLSGLYILLIVFEHDICITFSSDCHSLYVCMSDISCTLPGCMSHDNSSFVWLHVVCLYGLHIYPPASNSLGFGHFFHPGSHYCKCETLCVFAF